MILAHDQRDEAEARSYLALVRDDLEIHPAGDRVVETRRRGAGRHVELAGGERRDHLGARGKRLHVDGDALRLEQAFVHRDVESGAGQGGQVAHPHDVGGTGGCDEEKQHEGSEREVFHGEAIVYCAIMPSATQRVAARVVELRQARGLSQEALAKRTGLNRVTLARLERALHPPNLDTLDRIARALRVKLTDLVR